MKTETEVKHTPTPCLVIPVYIGDVRMVKINYSDEHSTVYTEQEIVRAVNAHEELISLVKRCHRKDVNVWKPGEHSERCAVCAALAKAEGVQS